MKFRSKEETTRSNFLFQKLQKMGKKYTVEKPNKKETAFYDDPISEAELMEMKSEGNKIDGKALYANDKF